MRIIYTPIRYRTSTPSPNPEDPEDGIPCLQAKIKRRQEVVHMQLGPGTIETKQTNVQICLRFSGRWFF
jgi:hypothetical protein